MGGQKRHQDRMSKPQCLRGVTREITTFGPWWLVPDIGWGRKEKSMFLMKRGHKATAPGPVAGAVARTLALVLRRDTRALGTDRNEKNKREQILASSWRRVFV